MNYKTNILAMMLVAFSVGCDPKVEVSDTTSADSAANGEVEKVVEKEAAAKEAVVEKVEEIVKDNELTKAEKAAGWALLFDGKTTAGWRNFGEETIRKGWSVVDGTLMHTKGGGNIVSEKQYADFELVLDWKVQPDGNSGIFYRVTQDKGAPWETGPEYQILDNNSKKYGDAKIETNIAGANYGMHKSIRDAVSPIEEWNRTKLIIKGNSVEHWLNGQKVVAYELNSEAWKKRVSETKFKAWPAYGTRAKGHFCLQDHGDKVWFKNIKIREIK